MNPKTKQMKKNDKLQISKERAIDPDLWVLELETDTFWNPLEEI